MNNTSPNNESKKIGIAHFVYIIIILVLIIIGIVSYFYSGNKKFVALVGFAATITSIILSVLAIFMSVTSNDSVSSLIHRFRDLHDAMNNVPNRVENSVQTMNTASDGLNIMMNEVTTKMLELNSSISKISAVSTALNDSMKEVMEPIFDTHQKVNMMSDVFNENKTNPSDMNFDSTDLESRSNIIATELINNTSYAAKMYMYAMTIAYKSGKEFNLVKFSELLASKAFAVPYLWGYSVCMSGLNLVDYDDDKIREKIVMVKYINETICSDIKSIILKENFNNQAKEVLKLVDELINNSPLVTYQASNNAK